MRKFAAITALLAVATTASFAQFGIYGATALGGSTGLGGGFQGGFVNGQEFDLLIRMDVPADAPRSPINGGGSLAFIFNSRYIDIKLFDTSSDNPITIAQAVANAPVGQIVNLGGYAFRGTTINGVPLVGASAVGAPTRGTPLVVVPGKAYPPRLTISPTAAPATAWAMVIGSPVSPSNTLISM